MIGPIHVNPSLNVKNIISITQHPIMSEMLASIMNLIRSWCMTSPRMKSIVEENAQGSGGCKIGWKKKM